MGGCRDEAGGGMDGENRMEVEKEREIERGKAIMKELLIFYRGPLIRSCTDTP